MSHAEPPKPRDPEEKTGAVPRPVDPVVDARLQRLEEAAMLGDDEREKLSSHVLELTRALERLGKRVDGLERRLSQLADAATDPSVGHEDANDDQSGG